jgi:putative hydrolase of the HAD superfamily
MSSHAQHLLLDFGSVVSKSLFEDLPAVEQEFGLAPGTLEWFGPLDLERDALWRDMLAGRVGEREYWAIRAAELSDLVGVPTMSIREVIRRSRSADPDGCLRPEAAALIYTAKRAGRRVAILSNELLLFYGEDLVRRCSILDEVDYILDATYTRILKPDPRAYNIARVALDVAPEEIVFVDDQARNIAGAAAVGLRTVHLQVTDPAAAFAEAARLLGL